MKKFFAIIILCLLIGVLIFEGVVYWKKIYNSEFNIKDSYIKKTHDGVKLLNIKKDNDKIIEKFLITLNGKQKNLDITYTLDLNSDIFKIENEGDTKFLYYASYVEDENVEDAFTPNLIKKYFNEDNFTIISGEDNKNYLVVRKNSKLTNVAYSSSIYLVFNDELEQINKDEEIIVYSGGCVLYLDKDYEKNGYKDKIFKWYKDNFDYSLLGCKSDCEVRGKIENNKIYNYVSKLNNKGQGTGTLEEREYTIKNNKLEYKVINIYTIYGGAGGCS